MSAPDPKCFDTPTNVGQWYEENKELFSPPICNKLMHRSQLQVMFVGGPNKRRDFHLDRGSEFFYQMRGNMKLPIILPFNKLRIVEIKEGEVFLLPSCVPHSPQRPEEGSLGLVVERERAKSEPDGLRYFEGFDFILNEDDPSKLDVDKILWERFFHCASLANDLLPVVKAYAASEEAQTNKAVDNVFSWGPPDEDGNVDRSLEPKFPVNKKIQDVPAPFNLKNWLAARRERLAAGEVIPLFNDSDDHPDKEFRVDVLGGAEKREFKGPEVEGKPKRFLERNTLQ